MAPPFLALPVPRMCLISAWYQLAWGTLMLVRGGEMLRPALGDYACLGDPLVSTWIRLVGTTLAALFALNLALARIRDPAAQRWIRLGSLAYWLTEVVLDGLLLQLPAYLAGAKHLTLVGIAVTFLGRSTLTLLWWRSRPEVPEA